MSDVPRIRPGVFFSPRADLPRGRHALPPEEVRAIQQERLMAALTELIAAQGFAAVTVTEIASHAGVSLSAFYKAFDDLAACADAAYERFISVLMARVAEGLEPTAHWHRFVESAIRGYLEALDADPVVARAMQVEMDAAGKAARERRRLALQGMAQVIAARHAELRQEDPTVGPLPVEAHLGIVYAVRQFACDALEQGVALVSIADPVVRWVAATVAGAALVEPSGSTGSTGRT